ncbi:fibroblast growth factor-binding protein 1 isoform X1 [Clupea harengus]|uniref:Fibroblast growth factor-binding protein 1 isoform X1 n=1 Tax=Clupea harengus TaxID=7950 RepID=A0A6P8G6B8_CLUHA|nr:fibroblast growth factor-binding protein 1 isoform X1 [Clupea harengus]XP_031434905.1 fibroblast growth factor-binding protein 1 isoform X1 [Clupea harengus]
MPSAAMRPFCSQLFVNLTLILIPVLLLLSLAPLAEARKKTAPAPKSAVPGSGELSTKAGHSCTWATSEASDGTVSLQVSCSIPGEVPVQTYECRFAGKPDQCPAYADKANQYWKQVVGKLRKRSNVCEGEKVLKTRLCKKAPSAAHVRLAERSGEDKTKEEEEEEEEKDKETAVPVAKETEVTARRMESEGKQEPLLGARVGDGADSESSNFCSEGWSSLCNFFTKFFENHAK